MNTIDYVIEVLSRYVYNAPLTYGGLKNILETAREEEIQELERQYEQRDNIPWNNDF